MSDVVEVDEFDKNRISVKAALGLSEEQMKKLTDFQIKQIGSLDNPTMEMMLCGYLLANLSDDKKITFNEFNASIILDAGIVGSWFEDEALGTVFDDLRTYFRARRKLSTVDEFGEYLMTVGYTSEKALMYKGFLSRCIGTVQARRISPDILTKRMANQYYCRKADKIIESFLKNRSNPQIGPEASIEQFRQAVVSKLSRSESGPIRECSIVKDYQADLSWILDMKRFPEKYKGLECGIKIIDEKTTGSRPGHLTVFVGAHGGFKSTVMMNMGYGYWKNGANVLYVSLEMENKLVKTKLWCCMTGKVPMYRITSGRFTQPEDWARRDYISSQLKNPDLSKEEKAKLNAELCRINSALEDPLFPVKKGEEDSILFEKAYQKVKNSKNDYRFINVGQSQKIKVSQIEKHIEDHMEDWKPDVVIVDYLALVDSDTAYPDRRDLEVGEVCKYLRKMGEKLGFSVVTAAQYKRTAMEKLKKFGLSEKAELGTDDLAESNQIGADADTVIMLWRPKDGADQLEVIFPKARHADKNTSDPKKLYVRPEICLVSDDRVHDSSSISNSIDVDMLVEAENETPDIKKAASITSGDWGEEEDNSIGNSPSDFLDEGI